MRIFLMDRKLNVSDAYLRPGFAFGGSCLPKDLRALTHAARAADVSLPLLETILPSNEIQIRRAAEAVLATRLRRVGVVGLSFKNGTDDLRESPMVALVETLIGKGCDVRILDRTVSIARLVGANRRYIEEEIPHIASLMCRDVEELLSHAAVLVIGNASEEAALVLAAASPQRVVIDLTRNARRPAATATPAV
jgi:GDP-mannose 6-dehydrogenase